MLVIGVKVITFNPIQRGGDIMAQKTVSYSAFSTELGLDSINILSLSFFMFDWNQ